MKKSILAVAVLALIGGLAVAGATKFDLWKTGDQYVEGATGWAIVNPTPKKGIMVELQVRDLLPETEYFVFFGADKADGTFWTNEEGCGHYHANGASLNGTGQFFVTVRTSDEKPIPNDLNLVFTTTNIAGDL